MKAVQSERVVSRTSWIVFHATNPSGSTGIQFRFVSVKPRRDDEIVWILACFIMLFVRNVEVSNTPKPSILIYVRNASHASSPFYDLHPASIASDLALLLAFRNSRLVCIPPFGIRPCARAHETLVELAGIERRQTKEIIFLLESFDRVARAMESSRRVVEEEAPVIPIPFVSVHVLKNVACRKPRRRATERGKEMER